MSIRITGGAWRGRTLRTVPGLAVRPTPAMLREALFNIIGPALAGARFLDLCAGCGAVAIEALSRGAGAAVLVESHAAAAAVIRRNLDALGAGERARLVRADATRAIARLARAGELFDAAFLDPPYGGDVAAAAFRSPGLRAIIRPRCRVFAQHRRGETPPAGAGWTAVDERRFGDTVLTTFAREEAAGP
jgi:16S rRNA (guanine(966)-N(2))-methyltransferase RsmD